MLDRFIEYLNAKITLSKEDIELVQFAVKIKTLRKKQFLIQEGDLWPYHVFVCEGLLRSYRVDQNGLEHIVFFAIENWWAGDPESTLSGNPSKNFVEAIEKSVVILIKDDNFNMLKTSIPGFMDFTNSLITRSLVAFQNRIHDNISLSAEARYLNYLSKYPHLANRVPQHMLASFLGITPATLSRVRKVTKKNKVL
ncbi:Crp/Fnr family transcriptional regulator [Mucilaginibacter jinjuensis]|uniref:Crp/Fnr family transcriptional regulator n=1 Tax=Mucilaginibacter jinjuensis TaxID=1176721 RepID=A0ABY7TDJ2_9SPHI|nr:Crp/Fnr family transcriptional regulator [Mucilaginibacter jinjuensis]WCT14263.1 Crp/Fnr family transcriptional regulator [Mucilaginibacter jinjuensis]